MKGVVFAALLSLVAGLEIRKPHRCGDPAAGKLKKVVQEFLTVF